MSILRRLLVFTLPHLKDVGHKEDESSTSVTVSTQIMPKQRHGVGRRGFVCILDHGELLESCQELKIGDAVSQQLRRNALSKSCQDIGDVCYEFVIGEFKLAILAVLIVLF